MRGRAATALVVAPMLAGCGGSSSVSPTTVTSAAAKTARAGSLDADFTIAGAGLKSTGTGTFNTGSDRSGRLSMTLEVNRRMNVVESIVTGNVLYMRSRVFAQAGLSGPKDWVKLDLGQLSRQGGAGLSSLATASPSPTTGFAYLRGAKDVKKVGTDTVAGVEATHYHVTADLQRAAARTSGSGKQAVEREMQASGRRTLPMDAWVDGRGYLRKVAWAEHAAPGTAANVTMVLHDFHAPVKIEPPTGHVIDLLQRLSGGSG